MRHELSWFVLSQVSAPCCCWFVLLSLIHQSPQTFDDDAHVLLLLTPLPLGSCSIFASAGGSGPSSTEWAVVPAAQWRTNSMIFSQSLDSPTPSVNGFPKSITHSLGFVTSKIAELEQNLGAPAARILAMEARSRVRLPQIRFSSRKLAFAQSQ